MYRIYKAVYSIKTEQNKTWEECCLRVPVVNIDKMIEEELGRERREAQEDDWDFSDFDEKEFVEKTDMSVENYPQPYCAKVSDLPTQCYQESLLELWAVEGVIKSSKIQIYLQIELLPTNDGHNLGFIEPHALCSSYKLSIGKLVGLISTLLLTYSQCLACQNPTEI